MPTAKSKNAEISKQENQEAPMLPMGYEARINSLRMNGNMKGTASVTLNGQFGVRGVNIMEGPTGLFVSMPSRKTASGEYQDICFPCTKEARAAFDKAVLVAYEQARVDGAGSQSQEPAETLPLQYDVRIHALHPGSGLLKGTASVNLNSQFAIRRVGIMESGKGLFVSMPSFTNSKGAYKDYCYPCTKEARAELEQAVLGAYEQAVAQGHTERRQTDTPGPFDAGARMGAPAMQM